MNMDATPAGLTTSGSSATIKNLFEDVYDTRSSASNSFYTKPSRLSVHANAFSRIGAKV